MTQGGRFMADVSRVMEVLNRTAEGRLAVQVLGNEIIERYAANPLLAWRQMWRLDVLTKDRLMADLFQRVQGAVEEAGQ